MKAGIVAIIFAFLLTISSGCNGQNTAPTTTTIKAKNNQQVGGGCDGCDIMYIGMPTSINTIDTSAGWNEAGQKLLVTGKVYQPDGQTPAPNIIIYYWHTDNNGYYSPAKDMDPKARRHGHIRGWVRSGPDGSYSIYTIHPKPYPGRDIPAHIHATIKEPAFNEYYIDELVFDDDPLLTDDKRRSLENRGGSGIMTTHSMNGLLVAHHDILLGRNIPGYPSN
jgi:protocatechuate 3,4-dioxygenase, beta subunit